MELTPGSEGPRGRPIRVLMVENDPEATADFRRRLRESGDKSLVAATAGSLPEALALIGQGEVDAVLLSRNIAEGGDLIAPLVAIRRVAPLTPVLLVVAPDESGATGDFLRAGAQDYILRGSINPSFLVRRLRSAIERKLIDEESRLLTALSLAVANASDHTDAMLDVLRHVGTSMRWQFGQVWSADPHFRRLEAGPFWSASPGLAAFREASLRAEDRPGDGLLWQVLRSRTFAWSGDLSRETRFRRATAAAAVGFTAAVFAPAIADDDVVAVFEFYLARTRPEDERLARIVAGAAARLGHVILRRRTEDALRESERRLRTLIERAYNGYAVIQDGLIREASPGVANLLGVPPKDVAGKDFLELVAPELRPIVRARLKGEYEGVVDVMLLHRDGHRLHVELVCYGSELRGRRSTTVALRDVSERRAAASRLASLNDCMLSFGPGPEQNIERLVGFSAESMGALWVLYCRRGQDGLRTAFSAGVPPEFAAADGPALRFCAGVLDAARPDLVLGDGGHAVKHGDTNPDILHRHTTTLVGRVVWQGGEPAGALCLGYAGAYEPSREDARFMGVITSAISVEEERLRSQLRLLQMEENLRQTTKMEAIGRLAGGVAHDFNNILTAVVSYAELLRDRLPESDPNRRDLEEILRAGERATGLTRQLLAFGRKAVVQPLVLDLNVLVAEAQGMLRRLLSENIVLETDLACEPCFVKADPVQLEQVIVNLAVNARDAMPSGGRLTIATARVPAPRTPAAPGTTPPGRVVLRVSDTGQGMPPEVLDHLFEPFFTTKDRGRGTGLGLATVYGIVQQSGGTVSVRSTPGHGTSFEIEFAASEPPEAAVEAGRPAPLRTGPETVLVVEDEASLREIIVRVLRNLRYSVLEAAEGTQALELAARHSGPIHLLLTDVVMPGLSGPDVASRLNAARPDCRVLYMSGYAGDALGPHAVLESEVAFLHKPFTPRALAQKVREVLEAKG